jgi:hypothetical protein
MTATERAVLKFLRNCSTYSSIENVMVAHKDSPEFAPEYGVKINFRSQRDAINFQMAVDEILQKG